MAGLFDSVFSPNTGWLGLPQQQQDPSIIDKLGLLFSDPFGKNQPFAGGLMSPGSDLNRLSQLATDPFGSQNPFPGAIGAPSQGGPSTNPADYANLASAFGGSGPNGNMPPLGAPPSGHSAAGLANQAAATASPPPQLSGPTLDQRAYGSPGIPQPQPAQLPPQAQSAMAQAPQVPPSPEISPLDRLSAGFQGLAHSGGGALPALANLFGGIATGQRQDKAGQAQVNQQTTMRAVAQSLMDRGYSPQQAVGMAQAAAIDPKVAEKILGDAYASPKTMEEFVARNAATAQRGGNGAPSAMDQYEAFKRTTSRGESAGKAEGERVANAQLDLPSAVAQANEAIRLTNELKTHKGRDNPVFWHSAVGGYLPDSAIPGNTDARDAVGILNSIKGGAFLEAFKTLKGGGQITEVEGKKATDAIARMDRSQSRAEFDRALSDYQGILKLGVDRASQLAGQPAPNGFKGNSDWQQVQPGVRIRRVQ